MINITFPDGNVRQYDEGTTAMQVAESISQGLARNVLSAEIDGEVWDANRPIDKDAKISLLTWNDKGGKPHFGTRQLTLWPKHWKLCIRG